MYLMKTLAGKEAKDEVRARPPFGPGMSEETIQKTERVEVWATSFSDADEFCEFRAFDAKGVLFATGRVNGY
jgi:hypothetical protein